MIRTPKANKIVYFFPGLLFIVNVICKALFIGSPEVSHDEPFSIYHAQFNVLTIIEQLKGYNNPPLYEILLHFWIKAFGISAASVRVLPMLFASLAPPALFIFCKRNFSLRVAIISSLLLSCSNLVTYHAHDCRVYTLFLLLSILSMHFFLEVLARQLPQLRTKFLFIFFSALLIYSHYFGFFVLFIQTMYVVLFYRKNILRMLIYYVLIALLYLPHIFALLTRFKHSVGGTWLAPPSGMESLYNMIWSFSNAPVIAVVCITLLATGLIITLVKRNSTKEGILVSMWFLFPFLGMFFLSFAVPMYISRYLIYAIPAFYVLLAICIEKITVHAKIHNAIAIVLLIGFISSVSLDPIKNTHVTELVNEVKAQKKENTAVLVCPFDLIDSFSYNYDKTAFSEVSNQQEYRGTEDALRKNKVFFGCDHRAVSEYTDVIYVIEGERSKTGQDTLGIAAAGYRLDHVTQVDDITKVLYYSK